MKLLKKAGAVFLALAMIAVMIPQLGSKVVKAATPTPHTITFKTENKKFSAVMNDTFFTYSPQNQNKDGAFVKKENVEANGSAASSDFAKGTAAKGNSAFGYKFTVPENQYATVIVYANAKNSGDAFQIQTYKDVNYDCTTEVFDSTKATLVDSYEEAIAYDSSKNADVFTSIKMYTNDTYYICTSKEMVIYKVVVNVYDSQAEAQAVIDEEIAKRNQQKKVNLSGTITSSIDLTNGIVKFKGSDGATKTSEAIVKTGENTYSYEVKEVNGNSEYTLESVNSVDVAAATKLISKSILDAIKFTTTEENYTDGNFELTYYDLPKNEWDFTDLTDWTPCSYQGGTTGNPETVVYKGLTIELTGGKFETKSNNIQTNTGTVVKIPVSGWGSVTCTFSDNVGSGVTLGDIAGSSAKTITANYKNAEFVELSINTANVYLTGIVVTPDSGAVVARLGAAVRQETEGWGNGIRFGAQLDLTKVDKDTCKSGTLIGLESVVGTDKKMTIDDAGKTCLDVERHTFIKEENNQLDYAAALINIPADQLGTKIVARPYVTVDGKTYYGEQVTTSYNEVNAKVANVQ